MNQDSFPEPCRLCAQELRHILLQRKGNLLLVPLKTSGLTRGLYRPLLPPLLFAEVKCRIVSWLVLPGQKTSGNCLQHTILHWPHRVHTAVSPEAGVLSHLHFRSQVLTVGLYFSPGYRCQLQSPGRCTQAQPRHFVIAATVFQSFLVLKASYLISTTTLMKL